MFQLPRWASRHWRAPRGALLPGSPHPTHANHPRSASKTARAREDAAKKAAAEGKGGGGAKGMAERNAGLSLVCQICRTSFMSTQSNQQLMAHVDSKQ